MRHSTSSIVSRRLPALLAVFVLGLAGCATDEVSTPTQPPSNPVPPTAPVTASVTVTVNPSSLPANSTSPASVVVNAQRSDGLAFPAGSQVTLTTTLGILGSLAGGSQITLDLVNGRAETVLYPTGTAGLANLRASLVFNNQTWSGTTNVDFRLAATFFIGSVSPNVGNPNGNESVTISGGGFDEPVRVLFGSTPATVLNVSPTSIRVLTPQTSVAAGQSVVVGVTVTINLNETGQATDTLPSAFTYTNGTGPLQPVILSVDPASGTNDGGTVLTINGDGFEAPVQVFFGTGTTADNFNGVEGSVQDATRTRILVVTPPARGFGLDNQNQLVNLLVKNVNSGRATVSTNAFRYGVGIQITAVSPIQGTYLGGTRVTIFGQGFDDPATVTLGGVLQSVSSVGGSEIQFITAGVSIVSCPASGIVSATPLRVTNIEQPNQTTTAPTDFNTFSYLVPLPRITGVNPLSGSTGNNTTITGQNFTVASSLQVLFGGETTGSAAQINSATATSISARVPSAPAGFVFNTEPCDGNGDGIAGGTRLTATPISVSVRNLDTSCAFTLPNAYTLNPPNSTCTGDTSVPATTQCSDDIDNDADTLIDFDGPGAPDPQCTSLLDNSESS